MPSRFVHTANEVLALTFYGIFYVLHSPILLVTGLARGRPGPAVVLLCAALLGLHGLLLHVTPTWEVETALMRVYADSLEPPPADKADQSNDERWLAFSARLDSNSLKYGFEAWEDLNETAHRLLGQEEYRRCMERLSIAPGEGGP